MPKISQNYVRGLFDYNEETGELIWKVRRGKMVKGSVVNGCNSHGYKRVGIDGTRYLAHKIIWLWWHGYNTENYVDHINRIKTDNRISNLREVSRSCNAINANIRVTNKSNVTGVSWNKNRSKWNASIWKNNKKYHIGTFDNKSTAVMARWMAEKSLKFASCNHKSSAYTYLKDEILR